MILSSKWGRFSCVCGLFLSLWLAGCSSTPKQVPVDLGPNVPLVGVRSAWTGSVGKVNFPLQMQVVGNHVYVAGSNGTVAAIDARTGGDLWRLTLVGTELSAGVGTDGRFVAVVNRENELINIEAGAELWRKKLGAMTTTPPLVAGNRIFIVSVDRTVQAFDGLSGRRLWLQQRSGDALALGQSGVLLAVGDTLVVGLGGRLLGLDPQNGNTRWDVAVASSRGTSEVERLVDLVSGVNRLGDSLCVRAFQSAIACVDAAKGKLVWTKPASGFSGLHGNADVVVGSESDGRIVARRRSDGERLWLNERLRFRSLSSPLFVGEAMVVGDDSGTLHFLSQKDAAPLNRVATDGSALVSAPVLAGQTVIVVTRNGGIFAFKPE